MEIQSGRGRSLLPKSRRAGCSVSTHVCQKRVDIGHLRSQALLLRVGGPSAPRLNDNLKNYRNATLWIPAISKRLRQRMFLQASKSSLRIM